MAELTRSGSGSTGSGNPAPKKSYKSKKPSSLAHFLPASASSLESPPPSNASTYTLDTFPNDNEIDHAPLLNSTTSPLTEAGYGHHHHRMRGGGGSNRQGSTRRALAVAGLKMATLFIVVTLILGGTLYLARPTLQDEDKEKLRIPKNFDDLKTLNTLLKKYRDIYPYRILISFICVYLYLQAFSLPGSMYMSILAGAIWGVVRSVPLVCVLVATGASLCYLISAFLAPALLTLPKWHARLDTWRAKVQNQQHNLFTFLIIIRLAPLPPHWVVNIMCPHVGIDLGIFWLSAAAGIFGVTVIHTTIGGELDEMTSADDFHLVSWRNFLGLSAIALGASLPIVLRRAFAKEEAAALEVERVEGNRNNGELVLLSDSEDRSSAVEEEDMGDGSEDERAGQEGMMDDRRREVV